MGLLGYDETIVVLLFGLKLVKVFIPDKRYLPELLHDILCSGDYDIPKEIDTIMQQYTTRQLRYTTLLHLFPIHDMQVPPRVQDLEGFIKLNPDRGFSWQCTSTFGRLPSDGSCLNLIVEELLPIEQLEGDERFRSREITLFLNQFQVNVFPIGNPSSVVAPGYRGDDPNTNKVWCKLVHQQELDVFKSLEPHNPSAHHIATLLLPPYQLPTGHHLITIPCYGIDLKTAVSKNKHDPFLRGPVIYDIARQLCEGIRFLHSYNLYHLDIKPQNVVIHPDTYCLTVIDLGWTMRGRQPCYVKGATGTYDFAPPEVKRWYEWLDIQPKESLDSMEEQFWKEHPPEGGEELESPQEEVKVEPKRYNPQRVDSWGVGNVIQILLCKEKHANEWDKLYAFSEWMMEERPKMDEALKCLDSISRAPSGDVVQLQSSPNSELPHDILRPD